MCYRSICKTACLILLLTGGYARGGGEAPASPVGSDPCSSPEPITGRRSERRELEERLAALAAEEAGLKYLLALLPDPANSFQAREFDLFFAAMIRAFELHGYHIRDSWLPHLETAPDSSCDVDGGPTPKYDPGLVVFQRDPPLDTAGPSLDRGPAVAVLIVGESPGQGAHAEALKAALRLIPTESCQGEPISVLGPSFSGSVDSLERVLRSWLPDHPNVEFEIVSGSATNPGLRCRLNRLPRVRYRSQATPDTDKREEMVDFLHDLGIWRLALLVENSTYGQTFTSEAGDRSGGDFQLVLPFPMHISSIRKAYSENGNDKDSSSDDQPHHLKLDLADRVGAGLPVFEPETTSATYALVLERILSTLARRRMEAVGIVATNIKDKLFLADEISRYVPNVRLFTFEGDELLAHPHLARATRGMLVASSHGPELHWKPVGTSRREPLIVTRFGNDASHGVFEAAYGLVGVLRGESSRLSTLPSSCHFRDPSRKSQPRPVWISVVGREGLVPLRVRRAGTDFQFSSQWDRAGLAMVPRGWILVCLLTLPVLAYLVLWVAEVRHPVGKIENLGSWRRLRHSVSKLCFEVPTAEEEGNHRRCRTMSLALLGITALGYLVLVAPVLARLLRMTDGLPGAGSILFTAALIAPVVVVLATLTWDVGRILGGKLWRYFSSALALLALCSLILYISLNPLERALDLDSGVSPTLPVLLLLLVCEIWVLAGVFRCQSMMKLTGVIAGNTSLDKLAEPRSRLVPAWSCLTDRRLLVVIAAALGIPGFYLLLYFNDWWFGFRLVRGIEESRVFDWGISLLLVISLGLMAEASYRYASTWQRLRRQIREWVQDHDQVCRYLDNKDREADEADDKTVDTAKRAKQVLDRLIGQIRTLMLLSTLGPVLILLAVLTYPFEPDRVLALYLSSFIAAGAVVAVVVNLQIARSHSLALVRRRREGWWNWERLGRLFFYLAIPGAGLIAGRFPGTLDQIFGFLEPLFNVFI